MGAIVPTLLVQTTRVNDIVDAKGHRTCCIGSHKSQPKYRLTATMHYRRFASFDTKFKMAESPGLAEAQTFGGDFYSHATRVGLGY